MHTRTSVLLTLAVLCLASACDAASRAAPRSGTSSTGAGSSVQAGLRDGERALAVVARDRTLSLYGVTATATARRIVGLPGPEGGQVADVTLSRGDRPRICATWWVKDAASLRCYEPGNLMPKDIPTAGDDLAGAVGLSTSGEQLAWAVRDPRDGSCQLVVERAPGQPRVRLSAYAKPDPDENVLVVGAVAWAGERVLLVSHAWDDDVNGSVAKVDLDHPPRGWTDAPLVPTTQAFPVISGAGSSTTGSSMLAVLEGFVDNGSEVFRAVETDVSAQGTTRVIAVAAKGRRVASVSGGPGGVLYATEGDTDTRFYWRAPGRPHGTLIEGLPTSTFAAFAQP